MNLEEVTLPVKNFFSTPLKKPSLPAQPEKTVSTKNPNYQSLVETPGEPPTAEKTLLVNHPASGVDVRYTPLERRVNRFFQGFWGAVAFLFCRIIHRGMEAIRIATETNWEVESGRPKVVVPLRVSPRMSSIRNLVAP